MPRCGCSGSSCSCLVVGGQGVTVTGVGSSQQPYSISATPKYEAWSGEGSSYGLDVGGNPHAVFHINSLNSEIWVNLPDGSISRPMPPSGSRIEALITGMPGMTVNLSGPLWFIGDAPSTETRGFYAFTLIDSAWVGRFIASS